MAMWQNVLQLLRQSDEQRRAKRFYDPSLVAHYWTGASPAETPVGDISASGFHLKTSARIYLGTILQVTLQKKDNSGQEEWITAQVRVVRWDEQGMGFEFVLLQKSMIHDKEIPANIADRKAMEIFLQGIIDEVRA
jgi:hypothetical protein